MISVKNSILGKSTGLIREFTAPFVGIYSTKEVIESFNDWLNNHIFKKYFLETQNLILYRQFLKGKSDRNFKN